MDVNSVNKPAVQPAQAPQRKAEIERKDNQPKENDIRKEVQAPPKPVINAQGQVTGRTLNVTA